MVDYLKCCPNCVYLNANAGDDIQLNSRTFLWPAELQIVLDLSAKRLSVIRENLEIALKYVCTNTRTYINTHTSVRAPMLPNYSRGTRSIMLESLAKCRGRTDRHHIVF